MEAVRRSFVRRDFTRPRIVLSACLKVDACRHDGQRICDEFVRWLGPHVDLVPVCPEVEIGLGVPRDTTRLVAEGEYTRMVQPAMGKDLTAPMQDFSQRYLDGLGAVDGFVLKAGSPSCDTGGIKVHAGERKGSAAVRTEPGLFAARVQEHYGDLAVETDGRLRNYPIRHHFLTRIFACAELRELGPRPRAIALADFQRRHKHLLMNYDQHRMRELGSIAADGKGRSDAERFLDYQVGFHGALARMPSHESYINSLMHMYGHFKNSLNTVEIDEFMTLLEDFRHHACRCTQSPARSAAGVRALPTTTSPIRACSSHTRANLCRCAIPARASISERRYRRPEAAVLVKWGCRIGEGPALRLTSRPRAF